MSPSRVAVITRASSFGVVLECIRVLSEWIGANASGSKFDQSMNSCAVIIVMCCDLLLCDVIVTSSVAEF